jgi:hypothetical protein
MRTQSITKCLVRDLYCGNPNHDHEGYDLNGNPTGLPMRCADCGAPAHYDYGIEDYQHDNPAAPPCFLIG